MLSIHYLLELDGYYWNGWPPPSCWSKYFGVRIFAKEDAELVLHRLFDNNPKVRIVESE